MSGAEAAALERLLELMRALRDPLTGCPWDRAQTHASLARYAIEEAYETAEAIASGDPDTLREELGDLLFQVVFHAQLGAERQAFDFAAIAEAIRAKLVRRHPHVFARAADGSHSAAAPDWEAHKARERAARSPGDLSALADIPLAAPALMRAAKLGARAAAVGFDWDDAAGARAKLDEEIAEVEHAISEANAAHVFEEIGDLLFTVAHWARHLDVDPESALRAANAKFERRFRSMEQLAAAQQQSLAAQTLPELEALWQRAKALDHPVQDGFTRVEDNGGLYAHDTDPADSH